MHYSYEDSTIKIVRRMLFRSRDRSIKKIIAHPNQSQRYYSFDFWGFVGLHRWAFSWTAALRLRSSSRKVLQEDQMGQKSMRGSGAHASHCLTAFNFAFQECIPLASKTGLQWDSSWQSQLMYLAKAEDPSWTCIRSVCIRQNEVCGAKSWTLKDSSI